MSRKKKATFKIIKASYPAKRYVSRKEVPRKKGKKLFELTEEWQIIYLYIVLGKGPLTCIQTYPIGFRWDGASVPPLGWFVMRITPGDASDMWSLPHDGGFRTEGFYKHHGQDGIPLIKLTGKHHFTFHECNDFMRAIMEYSEEFNKRQIRWAYRIVDSKTFGKPHFGGPSPSA